MSSYEYDPGVHAAAAVRLPGVRGRGRALRVRLSGRVRGGVRRRPRRGSSAKQGTASSESRLSGRVRGGVRGGPGGAVRRDRAGRRELREPAQRDRGDEARLPAARDPDEEELEQFLGNLIRGGRPQPPAGSCGPRSAGRRRHPEERRQDRAARRRRGDRLRRRPRGRHRPRQQARLHGQRGCSRSSSRAWTARSRSSRWPGGSCGWRRPRPGMPRSPRGGRIPRRWPGRAVLAAARRHAPGVYARRFRGLRPSGSLVLAAPDRLACGRATGPTRPARWLDSAASATAAAQPRHAAARPATAPTRPAAAPTRSRATAAPRSESAARAGTADRPGCSGTARPDGAGGGRTAMAAGPAAAAGSGVDAGSSCSGSETAWRPPSIAAWMLEQEARALLTRLDRGQAVRAARDDAAGGRAGPGRADGDRAVPASTAGGELRAAHPRLPRLAPPGRGRDAAPEEQQRRFTRRAAALQRRARRSSTCSSRRSPSAASTRSACGSPGWTSPPPTRSALPGDPSSRRRSSATWTGDRVPAIRRARTRLPGGGSSPVAIIRIPRERMVGHGIASSLVHEVGHQGAALLGLVESLRPALARAGRPAAAPRERSAWQLWGRWISEIVADFWSVASLGIASTLGPRSAW